MTRKQNFFGQLILTADLVVMMESYLATYWLRSRMTHLSTALPPMTAMDNYIWVLPVLVPSWLIALRYFQLYDAITYKSPFKIISALIKTQVFAALILFSAIFVLKSWSTSRSLLGLFILISFLGFAAEKLSVHVLMRHRWRLRRSTTAWKVLLVGSRADAEKYLGLVRQHPDWNMEIVGVVPAPQNLNGADRNGHGDLYSTAKG